MSKELFRFKQFECRHAQSSMKIGVDAVLIGAWVDVVNRQKILDVGTGCGVIAMMCAQRNSNASIVGIDIDEKSIGEAKLNFLNSPWSNRLSAVNKNYISILDDEKFDLIISNPPYFDSGVNEPDTPRLRARHKDVLSPENLLKYGNRHLSENGIIAMIIPYEQGTMLIDYALKCGFILRRGIVVKGREELPPKRILLEFNKDTGGTSKEDELQIKLRATQAVNNHISDDIKHLISGLEILILEEKIGIPTHQYKMLCKDFYLKF